MISYLFELFMLAVGLISGFFLGFSRQIMVSDYQQDRDYCSEALGIVEEIEYYGWEMLKADDQDEFTSKQKELRARLEELSEFLEEEEAPQRRRDLELQLREFVENGEEPARSIYAGSVSVSFVSESERQRRQREQKKKEKRRERMYKRIQITRKYIEDLRSVQENTSYGFKWFQLQALKSKLSR
jgi:hypothetical protein